MSSTGLPTVLVVYDVGAATPREIVSAAAGVCEVLFLYHRDMAESALTIELIEGLAAGIDGTGLSVPELVELLKPYELSGITTFSEYALRLTCELGNELGLRTHSPSALDRLTRKSLQRTALAQAGVDSVAFELVRSSGEVLPALKKIGVPAVLKPSMGTHSRDTFRLDRIEDGEDVALRLDIREDFVLEELLVGDPEWTGRGWGDHVSVEHVSFDGVHQHVVTLGKFPLAEPFRETGDFFPATLDRAVDQRVRELVAAALDALGVRDGITHTEVKFTKAGPRIIEVNGRLGGGTADIVRKAGAMDPVTMGLMVAMDRRPVTSGPTPAGVVIFEMSVLSPMERVRIVSLQGRDEIRKLPGVARVVSVARPGAVVDWRTGSVSQICTIWGKAGNHLELAALRERIHELLQVEYAPATDGDTC
ncbi:hypothetical protein [Micromonospora sp. WMMA1976]|uniref:ATP-grasp domain-containing protein n=1 Tax=Micromonospora sp. WMMA1976 TaxID=3014995 RepID=UPI00248C80ED|nr:hypothetical protein [Micromonospora sp. WMMA1976]WBC01116.1 hypothetical protein O7546_18285 [Micromonospora sp. WMMA1976]